MQRYWGDISISLKFMHHCGQLWTIEKIRKNGQNDIGHCTPRKVVITRTSMRNKHQEIGRQTQDHKRNTQMRDSEAEYLVPQQQSADLTVQAHEPFIQLLCTVAHHHPACTVDGRIHNHRVDHPLVWNAVAKHKWSIFTTSSIDNVDRWSLTIRGESTRNRLNCQTKNVFVVCVSKQ